jgi:hypothetical protein
MNQGNFFGMARRVLEERNPEVFDMSGLDAQLAASAKERAQLDAINDAKRAARNGENKPTNELARLRREWFVLEQRAKNTETYCNCKADEVKLLLSQLTDAINSKKNAVASGNALGERYAEHHIARLEGEVADAEREFNRARKVSAGAAIMLKEWPHRGRMTELEKSLA